MTDKENLKTGLEEVSDFFFEMYRKETDEYKAIKAKEYCDIAEDAITLLKEQEPVKALSDGEDSYMCNNCGTVIGWAEWEPGGIEEVKYKFCPECGRLVNWE